LLGGARGHHLALTDLELGQSRLDRRRGLAAGRGRTARASEQRQRPLRPRAAANSPLSPLRSPGRCYVLSWRCPEAIRSRWRGATWGARQCGRGPITAMSAMGTSRNRRRASVRVGPVGAKRMPRRSLALPGLFGHGGRPCVHRDSTCYHDVPGRLLRPISSRARGEVAWQG
jgi:hypothetical protein